MTGSLTLTTTCPNSMECLMYLNAVKMMHKWNFEFQIHYLTDDEAPRFETIEGRYNNLNELNESGTTLSLEPRVAEMQRPILEQIQAQRHAMMDALTIVRNAFLFGYRLFCHPNTEWMRRGLTNIRTLVGLDNDAMIEQSLVQQMEGACQYLSSKLGKDRYFLDTLRKL